MSTLPNAFTGIPAEAGQSAERESGTILSYAQHEVTREYGFLSWLQLVHHLQAANLVGFERALVLADAGALSILLGTNPATATTPIDGLTPLLALLTRSTGTLAGVRDCVELLLAVGKSEQPH